jgi:hypothetical protein
VPVDRPVLVAFAEQPLSLSGHTRYISNLMCWRDLDVGLLVGPAYGPRDVLHLISRVMELPAVVVGFDHRGERADHRPTGLVKEERYHVPFRLARGAGIWCLDLSLWLHDLHDNVTAWHEALCDSITDEQRAAVLRINDVWFRLPSYPDQVGGFAITPPVSRTAFARRSSSGAGSLVADCLRPELPYTRKPPRVVRARPSIAASRWRPG